MKLKFIMVIVCTVFVVITFATCSCHDPTQDRTIGIFSDDAEMNAAIAKARGSLPSFWQAYEKRGLGDSDFCLKVKIADKAQVEHFWVINIERKEGIVFGTIDGTSGNSKA